MGRDNSNPGTASAKFASQSLFHPPCQVVRLSLLRGKETLEHEALSLVRYGSLD